MSHPPEHLTLALELFNCSSGTSPAIDPLQNSLTRQEAAVTPSSQGHGSNEHDVFFEVGLRTWSTAPRPPDPRVCI